MVDTIKWVRDELSRYMGLWSAIGLISMALLMSAEGMDTTPLGALRQLLVRFGISGGDVVVNVESWLTVHSDDIGVIALTGVVGASVGCVGAVLRDSVDGRIWASRCSKAPVTLTVSCVLASQLGWQGLGVLVSFVGAGLACAAVLSAWGREYAALAALLLVTHLFMLAFYLPITLALGLFGWSNGRPDESQPAPLLDGVSVQ